VIEDPPLTERQRQLTAYVDDELSVAERASFERMLAEDPELAREAVKLKNLIDLSQSMALSEPSEREVRRFWARFYNRSEWRIGWVLFTAGLVVLIGESLYLLMSSDQISWTLKGAILSTLIGGALLLWNTVRLKLRTSHFDRYRGVIR